MKVTVTKYLNVRVGKPSLNAPCYQYLAPGSEIEVEDQSYTGDSFDGINTWLKDRAGNYYWSGGVKSIQFFELAIPHSTIINYNSLVKSTLGPRILGNGVNVALLDSGINVDHPDLNGAVVQSLSFVDGQNATDDPWGHGTLMAGFIGGRTVSTTGILGVAPKCNLINLKVVANNGVTKMMSLKNCLNHIINNQQMLKIDIINLSISISDLTFITKELSTLAAMEIKVIAAAGTEEILRMNTVRLLAQHPRVDGVGVTSDIQFGSTGTLPAALSCFYQNKKLFSTSNNGGYQEVSGDSIFTAITSGLAAIAIQSGQSLVGVYISRSLFTPDIIAPFK